VVGPIAQRDPRRSIPRSHLDACESWRRTSRAADLKTTLARMPASAVLLSARQFYRNGIGRGLRRHVGRRVLAGGEDRRRWRCGVGLVSVFASVTGRCLSDAGLAEGFAVDGSNQREATIDCWVVVSGVARNRVSFPDRRIRRYRRRSVAFRRFEGICALVRVSVRYRMLHRDFCFRRDRLRG